jgi:hypothetical protein
MKTAELQASRRLTTALPPCLWTPTTMDMRTLIPHLTFELPPGMGRMSSRSLGRELLLSPSFFAALQIAADTVLAATCLYLSSSIALLQSRQTSAMRLP